MTNVLADLALDSEAATTVVLRIAGAIDRAVRGDAAERSFRRLALSVTKYWLCKRLASHTVEALECLGGNGYIEDSGMPRLYREAPLVSIWEGSGNVAALDTLRAMTREAGRRSRRCSREFDSAAGARRRLRRRRWPCCARSWPTPTELQFRARHVVERLALVLQASLLLRHGHPRVAEAFVRVAAGGGGRRGLRHAARRHRHRRRSWIAPASGPDASRSSRRRAGRRAGWSSC